MILQLARDLDGALRAKGVPIPVVPGPERAPASSAIERIVVEEDDSGDTFDGPVRGPRRARMTHEVGFVVRMFVRSNAPGALAGEHRRRARKVLHIVLIALDNLLRGNATLWLPKSGAFVVPTDLEGTETWPGAVYELHGVRKAGVQDLDWAGDGPPTGTIGSIASTTRVRLTDEDDVACGGA